MAAVMKGFEDGNF